VQAVLIRRERLGADELAVMDIDGERLDLMRQVALPLEDSSRGALRLSYTTSARDALRGADFVITTFRVGGIESRVIDERVPLDHGVLGQETTGAGGFAMAMRTLPVLYEYLALMREMCPSAWLINFANPAGLLTEALRGAGGWKRAVGICDAPSGMQRVGAALLGTTAEQVHLDYFGLNHLGWVRSLIYRGEDRLPRFMAMLREGTSMPGLPFDPAFVARLGMIPNEYLYYYYHSREAVANILRSGETRGEYLVRINRDLFATLRAHAARGESAEMVSAYAAYMGQRGQTYMTSETGHGDWLRSADPAVTEALAAAGYAGVALDVMEALRGSTPREMVLNIPNEGAVAGMEANSVVEIPAAVSADSVRPLNVGAIPPHCLGLMLQVKAYEQMTIRAALERSLELAVSALAVHPLVADVPLARTIVEEYRQRHGALFPDLR
jgi:alpha-galactosidase/6-phospho-beta-glucosidase family protein